MRRRLATGLAGVLLVVGGGLAVTTASASGGVGAVPAPGSDAAGTPAPPRPVAVVRPPAPGPVVLVSGRDDHGELASAVVAVHPEAGSATVTGDVPDGTLARVVAIQGTWLQVRTLEGPPVQGWVDDFYLRREIHLVGAPPGCRSALDGHSLPAGQQAVVLDVKARQVRVQVVGGETTGWAPRAAVHELAPTEGCGSSTASATHTGGHHH
ncbi:hypothetical protein GCM10009868_20790 [Terrabacter aerolatus]|uniref:SH3b domain-containing protein n=1 Tax=Terrabacter aerolatus TaxID=422442 RepID=A0A512D5Y2_9MICO|nr:hypothetical protein [Terrabacter aerolatus]GEO31837.1 hypothetical protein TAE01_36470 [Terrabacter aerolatus]